MEIRATVRAVIPLVISSLQDCKELMMEGIAVTAYMAIIVEKG